MRDETGSGRLKVRVSWTDRMAPDGLIYEVVVSLDNTDAEYQFAFDVACIDWLGDPEIYRERILKARDILMADYERQQCNRRTI